jgi:ATP-binding cassette subfamily E protein 1
VEEDDKGVITKAGESSYPKMEKQFDAFKLTVHPGIFMSSEIVVLLGENGTGKSTMIHMLAGILKPDNIPEMEKMSVSIKPQKITPKFQGDVRGLLDLRLKASWMASIF